ESSTRRSKRPRSPLNDQQPGPLSGFGSCVKSESSMSSAPIHVVVLAAGQGTRMKSSLPKVLHRVPGGSMLNCVLRTAGALSPETLTGGVGHGADAVRALLAPQMTVQFALQQPQLGTAHALMQAAPILAGRTGTV